MSYNLDVHGNTCPYAKCLCCLTLTETGLCQEIFLELINIKNNETPLHRSRVVTHRPTDMVNAIQPSRW